MKYMRIYVLLLIAFSILISCKTQYFADAEVRFERVSEADIAPDSVMLGVISPYKQALDEEMNVVIGYAETDLERRDRRAPESTLGNWVVDMFHDELVRTFEPDLDFTLQNAGGIRVPFIGQGPILLGQIYEVMPFDNMVTIMEGDSTQVQSLLDHVVQSGGWPVSHTLHFITDGQKAFDIKIKGVPLKNGITYSFALPDYIANGGDNTDFLMALRRKDISIYIRDLFINHIKAETAQGIRQSAALDGRVKKIDL